MSFHSTFNSASIRGYSSSSSFVPSNYDLLYSITTTANRDSRYTNIFVSREDIGNGQFIVSKQDFLGNVVIRNPGNTFTKTITGLTANSTAGAYNAVINEQGNLVIVGNSDYIKVYEYQGSNYTFISNLRPIANVQFFNGASIDISSNANIMIAGCLGSNTVDPFIAVYNRSGNTFTLTENITSTGNTLIIGSSVSISSDGNTLITDGVIANTTNRIVLVYAYANGNYTLDTTIPSTGVSSFADSIRLNSTGNIAMIRALSRTYVYAKNGNTWTQTGNLQTFDAIGANNSSLSWCGVDNSGTTVLLGNPSANTNTGRVINYFNNGGNYNVYTNYTYSNGYTNSEFGHNVASDSVANIFAATNFYNGANSNVHVLSVYQKS